MRYLINIMLLMLLLSVILPGMAQLPERDTLPDSDLMTVEAVPDELLQVTVQGEAGAVFQSSQVAVRNLNTGDTVFGQANFDGSFRVTLTGTPHQMYQVNAARSYPPALRDTYDVLPGAGVILYEPAGTRTFETGGELSYGGATWHAEGTFNTTQVNPGETFSLQLDVIMQMPEAALNLDYTMSGTLYLWGIGENDDNRMTATAPGAGYDWANTSVTGLPVTNLADAIFDVASTTTDDITVDDETSTLAFTLQFDVTDNDRMLFWILVPAIAGEARIADSEPFNWYTNRVFSTEGTDDETQTTIEDTQSVLPVVLQLNPDESAYLPVSLFGRAPENPVQFYEIAPPDGYVPPVTVRSPGTYALAPMLVSLLRYGDDAPPIIPVMDATLTTTVIAPDNTRNTFESGGLVTLDNRMYVIAPDYEFLQYGVYHIEQAGTVTDAHDNEYDISGTYEVTIAEPLTIQSATLPGVPFEVGNTFDGAFQVSPAFPAEKTITLIGSQGQTFYDDCTANCRHIFENSGEYSATYNATYTDSEGRLWAGSLRTAGVITEADVIATGGRGLLNDGETPQAWFDTRVYPPDVPDAAPVVNMPFFSGDVAFLPDDDSAGIHMIPGSGIYSNLTIVRATGTSSVNDSNVEQAGLTGYAGFDAPLTLADTDLAPEDILLLFYGKRGAASIAAYASVAVITDDDFARVMPPFSAPLLNDRGNLLSLLVLSGNLLPGQILTAGDSAFFTAQSVPPLPVDMTVTLTAPDGTAQQQMHRANTFGYVTSDAFTLDMPGIWQVDVRAFYAGVTSAGALDEPVTGTVPGADGTRYTVFVVPDDASALETNRSGETPFAPGQPVTLNLRAPDDWQNVRAYAVLNGRGVLLDQAELEIFSNQTNYTYNPAEIARLYPNIDEQDIITLSFAMTGTDADGQERIRARVFTWQQNTLITTDNPDSDESDN